MSPERNAFFKSVFDRALELAEGDRNEFLARAIPDPEERRDVERLIESYEPDYLALPAIGEVPHGRSGAPDEPAYGTMAGRKFGPYSAVSIAGCGGMGTVYLARRDGELSERRVALKVISGAGNRTAFASRLRREMRVLSKLDHPYIVKVLDAGTDDGDLYFVMEYVEGLPLDAYCREKRLGKGDRLALFLKVCDAVSYAHGQLVVHRDLKPANIIVTEHGVPKLIDFGLAKLLEDESDTRLTVGGETLYTLRYASPEQIVGTDPPTTRTDIYSLGVILYELLTQQSPFGDETGGARLLAKRLSSQPVRPREADPSLAKDLDTILLKALREEPAERYDSISELAADIRCYLSGHPVSARRGTGLYSANLFVRRHALALAVGILLFACAAGGGRLLWLRDRESKNYLGEALATVAEPLLLVDPAYANGSTVRETTRQLGKALVRQLQMKNVAPEVQLSVLKRLVTTGEFMASAGVSVTLGDTGSAVEILAAAVADAERLHTLLPGNPDAGAFVSRSYRALGSVYLEMGSLRDAEAIFQKCVDFDRTRFGKDPLNPEVASSYADSLATLSRVYLDKKDESACLRLRSQSVEYRRRLAQANPSPGLIVQLAGGLSTYCAGLVEFRRYDEALTVCRESSAVLDSISWRRRAEREPNSLRARNNLHMVAALAGQGKAAEALDLASEAVGGFRRLLVERPLDASARRGLAAALIRLAEAQSATGDRESAASHAREAIVLAGQALQDDPESYRMKREADDIVSRGAALAAKTPLP